MTTEAPRCHEFLPMSFCEHIDPAVATGAAGALVDRAMTGDTHAPNCHASGLPAGACCDCGPGFLAYWGLDPDVVTGPVHPVTVDESLWHDERPEDRSMTGDTHVPFPPEFGWSHDHDYECIHCGAGLPASDPADAPGAAGAGADGRVVAPDVVRERCAFSTDEAAPCGQPPDGHKPCWHRDPQHRPSNACHPFTAGVAAPDVVGATQVLTPATDSTLTPESWAEGQVRFALVRNAGWDEQEANAALAAIEAAARKDERDRWTEERLAEVIREAWTFKPPMDSRQLAAFIVNRLAAIEADR